MKYVFPDKHLVYVSFMFLSFITIGLHSLQGANTHKALIIPQAKIIWHWQDEFTTSEKEKLQHWLRETMNAIEKTLGIYPFDIHFYMYRGDNAGEPVPWAHTERGDIQGVHFYVNTSYSLEMFLQDWTAPHEISHLSIPFLGRENAWFAEGYASFMQYQVMQKMDIYSEAEVNRKYNEKIKRIQPYYNSDESLIAVARNLQRENKYPQMYWGSASFFVELNNQLNSIGYSLSEIMNDYLQCCRMEDKTINGILQSFDDIVGTPVSTELLKLYKQLPAKKTLMNKEQNP